MTKAQDNVKNYIDKITKDDPIIKEMRRHKIDEMEKQDEQFDFLAKRIVELELEGTITDMLRNFMRMTMDELKSQADRMARIEKAMAEVIKVEDDYVIETGNEIKVEETD
jgi:flagellar motor component MotA